METAAKLSETRPAAVGTQDAGQSNLELLETRICLSPLTFSSPATFALGTSLAGIALYDVNGDGKADLILSGANGSSLSVMLGNGNGTFQSPQTFFVGADPTVDTVADLNGDGNADLIALSHSVSMNDPYANIFLGNGNGTFKLSQSLLLGYRAGMTLADVNGDGKTDIVDVTESYQGPPDKVGVFFGNGNGTFQPETQLQTLPAPGQNLIRGTASGVIGALDLNGDGKADLVDEYGTGAAGVLFGNGNGTFEPAQTFSLGQEFDALAVNDFNGDGIPDILAFMFGGVGSGAGGADAGALLLGNGNGTFQTPQIFSLGNGTSSMSVVGDLNGDGVTDLIYTSHGGFYAPANTFAIFSADSSGTFQVGPTFALGFDIQPVQAADLTGDGKADLFVADASNLSDGIFAVLFNTTPGPTLSNGLLTVTGTSGSDTISATDSDGAITVTLNSRSSGPYSGVTGIKVLPGAGDDSVNLSGLLVPATVRGAGGDDTIVGSDANDSLCGGAGNDSLTASGGNTTISGGAGNDALTAASGNELLLGGPGDDTLYGAGGGHDTLMGNSGNDGLIAGSGSSLLLGGPGNDTLLGSLFAGYAPDTLSGGVGSNNLFPGPVDFVIGQSIDT